MVQTFHDVVQFKVSDRCKITLFRNVLSDQAIHVFVCSSFPGGIRMSKKEIDLQFMCYPFMFSKLLAIISSDSMQAVRYWQEQVNHGMAHLVGSALFNFGQQSEARFTGYQGDNPLMMSFANDRVYFPIADPLALFDNHRSFFNAHSVWQLTTPVIAAIAFPSFFLAA